MHVICLVIDRLHIGYLGAYGNSWIETPELDRLASQSFVLDQALIDSPQLDLLYRSYWQGWHALCPPPPADRPGLARLLSGRGVRTVLVTDDPAVADHRLAQEFDERIELDSPRPTALARSIADTSAAQYFAQVIDLLQSAAEPLLLWCHCGALGTAWDAPREYRRRYVEEGDPEPSDSAAVPSFVLPKQHDPDQVLAISQAYAGQVSLWDACLGGLLEFLEESPLGRETCLVLTAARGFPLGEHGTIGGCGDQLYAPLVHVPWLMRLPDLCGAATRSQVLAQPSDLWVTLLDWWGVADRPESPTGRSLLPLVREEAALDRDRACLRSGGDERAIRTPAWHLRIGPQSELFSKPDDKWDVNNVAERCREIVTSLGEAFEDYVRALTAGRLSDLPPLESVLTKGLE